MRELWARTRLRGGLAEKFGEDPTRVVEAEAHPGAYNLLGSRDAELAATGGRLPGAPRVEFADLLAGPLGQQWPPLRYKHEFFARYLPRGPSLQYLEVDPGPMYAISSAPALGEDGLRVPGEGAAGIAPSLLAITRSFAGLAAPEDDGGGGGGGGGAGGGGGGGEGGGFPSPDSAMRRSATAPAPLGPAGAYSKGSIFAALQGSTLALQSGADREWDLSRSVGQQFAGPQGGGTGGGVGAGLLSFTTVGPNQAVVTVNGSGARAAALNGALLGRTVPGGAGDAGAGPTLATEGLSGGAVFSAGASGLGGGSVATVQTVVHPLDAFPATKRLVADEKVAQVDAEHLRRRVLTNAVRRDVLLARRYPHGALGVDHIDNAESAVFGELAARRVAERDRSMSEAAFREARILGVNATVARRGYDFLRPDAAALPQTLRVEPSSLAFGDARAARLDGVKDMQALARAADPLPPHQTTHRTVLGERDRFSRDWKFQSTSTSVLSATALSRDNNARTDNLSRQASRAGYNLLSHGAPIVAPAPAASHAAPS